MKESERIRLEAEADTSDNDYRDCNYLRKIERAERLEKFEEEILPKLIKKYRVDLGPNTEYVVYDQRNPFSFFPKAGSVRFHKTNKWIKYGWNYVNKLINSGNDLK